MPYADYYNADNVVIGNAIGFFAPYNPTTPLALPANTVALWGAWPVGWASGGATNEGYAMSGNTNLQQHNIEEQAAAVATGILSKDNSISAALAEDTMENLAKFMGGTVAATAGPPSVDTLTPDDELRFWHFGLEMVNKFGLARRFYFKKCVITPGGQLAWRRAQDKRLMPITITPQGKPSDNKVVDIKALA